MKKERVSRDDSLPTSLQKKPISRLLPLYVEQKPENYIPPAWWGWYFFEFHTYNKLKQSFLEFVLIFLNIAHFTTLLLHFIKNGKSLLRSLNKWLIVSKICQYILRQRISNHRKVRYRRVYLLWCYLSSQYPKQMLLLTQWLTSLFQWIWMLSDVEPRYFSSTGLNHKLCTLWGINYLL